MSENILGNQGLQLRALIRQGLSIIEASQAMGIDEDAARLALDSSSNKSYTVDELIAKHKPRVVEILMQIAELSDNDNARVKACQILLTGQGELPGMNLAKLNERFEKMKHALNIIDTASDTAASIVEQKLLE